MRVLAGSNIMMLGVDLDSHLRPAATWLPHLTQMSGHRKELEL